MVFFIVSMVFIVALWNAEKLFLVSIRGNAGSFLAISIAVINPPNSSTRPSSLAFTRVQTCPGPYQRKDYVLLRLFLGTFRKRTKKTSATFLSSSALFQNEDVMDFYRFKYIEIIFLN